MSHPLLSLRGVHWRWPHADADTLAIEQFDLATGATTFVRGPSGCGKSTLLSLVAGVLIARSGTVSLLGQDWRALSPARRDRWRAQHVGYIFQQFNLLPYLSVLDNVLLPCRFSPARAARGSAADAHRLLEQTGLPRPLWARSAAHLSVGQQQRVAAARALIGQPALVIADEPTSALDEALRESFMDMLLGACSAAGSALLFVSHDTRLAPRFQHCIDLPALNRATEPA